MANRSLRSTTQDRGVRQRQNPVDQFHREMDTLFDRFFGGGLASFGEDMGQMRVWDFGMTENDNEIVVRAEMPGFDEKELDVRLENDVLTIRAEKEQKGEGREKYRSFFRQVSVPAGIDAEKVKASYRNGVLELHIPRPEESKARRITVQGRPAVHDKGGKTEGNGSAKAEPAAHGEKTEEKGKTET